MSNKERLQENNENLQAPVEKASSLGGGKSYTNVLDNVGFQTDKIMWGDAEKDNPGTDLTGYIVVKDGDVIRLKNVTMPEVDGEYRNCVYFSSGREKPVLSGDQYFVPVFKDGNVVQFTVSGNDLRDYNNPGWIRINAENIDTKSIITVNEEI